MTRDQIISALISAVIFLSLTTAAAIGLAYAALKELRARDGYLTDSITRRVLKRESSREAER